VTFVGTNSEKRTTGFVCQIVGDGSYLFSVPRSVYWTSQRYEIPILTIVLNNRGYSKPFDVRTSPFADSRLIGALDTGWNAPRRSLCLVHPDGEASRASSRELSIAIDPTPDYVGIAKAAACGKAWAGQAGTVEALDSMLPEAIEEVRKGTLAVLEVYLESPSTF